MAINLKIEEKDEAITEIIPEVVPEKAEIKQELEETTQEKSLKNDLLEFGDDDNFKENELVDNINEEIIDIADEEIIEETKLEQTQPETVKSTQQDLFNTSTENESNKTLGEQLGKNKTSINDMLAQRGTQQDVATRLTAKPISDIKLAIGVGDRFLFIKELFNGDGDVFNNTIEHLNSLISIEDANSYLNNKFNWSSESNTVKHFMSIVQRKYFN
ncbi:MAG: hypothetical protein GX879_09895 [Bacteroidales bacterium]|nr:hypothetical protein [Bacteroidales bacterium]